MLRTKIWALLVACAASADPSHKYCIIGAGPGGIQMAYYLQTAGEDYVVYEKEGIAAEFYTRMPVHRTIISINKKYTGQSNFDFNLRHDWNSFLQDLNYTEYGDPYLFTEVTDDYWPHADDYVLYVNKFVEKYQLKINYNHSVKKVTRILDDDSFDVDLQHGNTYSMTHCDVLIQATGANRTYLPDVKGKELLTKYDELTMDLTDYYNKSVLIIGCANSAMETADHLASATYSTHIVSRHCNPGQMPLAAASHYPGDIRSVNLKAIDRFHLKSMDGISTCDDVHKATFEQTKDGKIQVYNLMDQEDMIYHNAETSQPYDKVILAIGWKYDTPGLWDLQCSPVRSGIPVPLNKEECEPQWGSHKLYPSLEGTYPKAQTKFPSTTPFYESVNIPNLFFSGAMNHGNDFKKATGGVVHGYRYFTRMSFNKMQQRYNNKLWPHTTVPASELSNTIAQRMHYSSGLYQLYGVAYDVMLLRVKKPTSYLETGEIGPVSYLEECPRDGILECVASFSELDDLEEVTHVFTMDMEWGDPKKGAIYDNLKEYSPAYGKYSVFVHPIIRLYEMKDGELKYMAEHHVIEDWHVIWDNEYAHLKPLEHYINTVVEKLISGKPFTKDGLEDFPKPQCKRSKIWYDCSAALDDTEDDGKVDEGVGPFVAGVEVEIEKQGIAEGTRGRVIAVNECRPTQCEGFLISVKVKKTGTTIHAQPQELNLLEGDDKEAAGGGRDGDIDPLKMAKLKRLNQVLESRRNPKTGKPLDAAQLNKVQTMHDALLKEVHEAEEGHQEL